VVTDLAEAKKHFELLHGENDPPDLVFTVNSQEQNMVAACVNELFANATICQDRDNKDPVQIYQQIISKVLAQKKVVCLQRNGADVIMSP
jgi:hypothetical protein